jgi:site-specific recombinase XerD
MRFSLPLAQEPSLLPLSLSRHDLRQLFAAAEPLRDRTLLQVTYNAGLRASQALRAYGPDPGLFPGRENTQPLARKTAYLIFQRAKDRAGSAKPGGLHLWQHAFATHLLEAGVALHTIPRLLGHTSIQTTLRYFHGARQHLLKTPSSLELREDSRFVDG